MGSQRKSSQRTGARSRTRTARKQPFGWRVVGIAAAVVVTLMAAFIFVALSQGDDTEERNALTEQIDGSIARLRGVPQDGLSLGSPDAPVVIEIFEDFQCPFCILFTANVEPVLVDEYVAAGKVRLVYQNYPILGFESEAAARASVCAGEQRKGWEYLLSLFRIQAAAGQTNIEKLNVGRFDNSDLTGLAKRLGLDERAFDQCVGSGETGEAVVASLQRGAALGVRGTPSFAVNGQLVSLPLDAGAWRQFLDAELARAGGQATR